MADGWWRWRKWLGMNWNPNQKINCLTLGGNNNEKHI